MSYTSPIDTQERGSIVKGAGFIFIVYTFLYLILNIRYKDAWI